MGLVGLILSVAGLAFLSLSATRPTNLGVQNETLAICLDTPNCVSSRADASTHSMPPISIEDDPATAIQSLRQVIVRMDGATVISSTDDYLYCEFTTPLFRFVDDVEFLIDHDQRLIHFRSASRTGYDDLGTNRRRMEEVRRLFAQVASNPTRAEPSAKSAADQTAGNGR